MEDSLIRHYLMLFPFQHKVTTDQNAKKVPDGTVHSFLDPCVCPCFGAWLMAMHSHHRSSIKGWIFVQTSTPARAGSTEPAVNAGWTELCQCAQYELVRATSLKGSLNRLKMKTAELLHSST